MKVINEGSFLADIWWLQWGARKNQSYHPSSDSSKTILENLDQLVVANGIEYSAQVDAMDYDKASLCFGTRYPNTTSAALRPRWNLLRPGEKNSSPLGVFGTFGTTEVSPSFRLSFLVGIENLYWAPRHHSVAANGNSHDVSCTVPAPWGWCDKNSKFYRLGHHEAGATWAALFQQLCRDSVVSTCPGVVELGRRC